MDSLEGLIAETHPVDRDVIRIWARQRHTAAGPWFLDPVRRSLYGNRYWPRVHSAIALQAPARGTVVDRAFEAAATATRTARVDRDQLLGIALVAVELFDRLGPDDFLAANGRIHLSPPAQVETPSMVLRRRAKNTPEGLLGRWRGARRRWRVTFEPDPSSHYTVVHGGLIAPCRGGNHEHCAVGIVAGADRLSPADGAEPFPIIRRACETRVFGRVSLLAAP